MILMPCNPQKPQEPKTVDDQLEKGVRYLDRAVELATDDVQMFKIRKTLQSFIRDISL